MVRVALVGVGFMGRVHLAAYGRLAGVAVTALCDDQADLSPAEAPAGARPFASIDAMLAAGGFDVVDICLPTDLHAHVAVSAMEAGYHVICEKPMALTHADALRMARTAAGTGRLLFVAQCLRFWPAYTEIRRLIEEGTYGAVRYASFDRISAPPSWSGRGWFRDPARSGGALLDLHIHDVDMILHLFGPPQALISTGVLDEAGAVSHVSSQYRYEDRVVTSFGGWLAADSHGFTMRALVAFEGATVDFSHGRDPQVWVYPDGGEPHALELAPENGYFYELHEFAEGVRTGTPSAVVTPESAAESVRVCRAEERSIREGREVWLR